MLATLWSELDPGLCKYQYVLAVQSLPGAGTYQVEIQIGGNTVGTAQFDLT